MKSSLLFAFTFFATCALAQVTVSPSFPTADEPITITYDATQGTTGLIGASRVFMHSGVVLSGPTGTGWQHVVGNWGDPASPGELTSLGSNKWSITITPRQYYAAAGLPANARVYRLGVVFREAGPCGNFGGVSTACKEGKSPTNGDVFIDIYEADEFSLTLTSPTVFPIFVNNGQQISISAQASASADMLVKINGATVASQNSVSSISHTHTVTAETGTSTVVVQADNGEEVKEVSFAYTVRTATVNEGRPAGIIDGINYAVDHTQVTLGLWAPGKTSVYVIGDFNDWQVDSDYQMKKDGEHFWIEIDGLTPGEEYAYQYLVNESIYIADPYADKIIDPDDQYIPASSYPGLKPFPEGAKHGQWYFNRASVFQTNQTPYNWQVTDFQKPDKDGLVIYELLIRDFFASDQRTYQNLIDTIPYFKQLGVNAIELMPIMEYSGNESWGYNPNFMFATDKYYGTKNKFKEFVDKCHQNGIAIILDIALNHQDLPNSYLLLDFNFAETKPKPENKWFNVTARHPYNVFFDMNHESAYTKKYVDTIAYHWLNEYKVDGFRFDLSKGFTQNDKCGGSTTDEACISQKDNSRIAILNRMADVIWSHTPDALLILEHFADNTEEKELSDHGFMLWGNLNHAYNENTMGYLTNSDISWVYHGTRGWADAHVVGYMESHDEERMMYRNQQSGRNVSGYNTKNVSVALNRMKTAATIFYTIPGPKMLWQFGELGYDYSINHCPDGSNSSNCRVDPKPVKWEYYDNAQRFALHDHISDLLHLRSTYDVFSKSTATLNTGNTAIKQIILKNNPYTATPANAGEMNAVVAVNFDVFKQNATITFPHAGTWYEHYAQGTPVEVTGPSLTMELAPGAYKLFTDVQIDTPPVLSTENGYGESDILIYPNPSRGEFILKFRKQVPIQSLQVLDIRGVSHSYTVNNEVVNISQLPAGLYILKVTDRQGRIATEKLLKE